MFEMQYKIRGESENSRKRRVYFTCHPDDFERYFEKISEDIFKSAECVIYYTGDMTEEIPEEDKEIDLGNMNLFVVPVTFRLFSKPNRAMDSDIAYAMEKHIPILPFMMESGIDEFYSKPEKFGELQYINPYSHDLTEISYEEKLKKYLESVLISDETVKRIREAFDAYIFLSYRKKDRKYANELMRIIHAKPECRDIAIWYDEFLTPGESFKENIGRMLSDSKLFTLLVTPNLLEEPDGKPNFVMANEYPEAKKSGMDILPAEMVATDREKLQKKFKGIPECVDPHDEDAFKERLLESISKIAIEANDDDPEHNFLIGLAYLDGIDVEINGERAVELITKAAEAELPEAIKKLVEIYDDGKRVVLDYRKALVWAERLHEHNRETLGEENTDTLMSLNNLAVIYGKLGEYRKELELEEKAYALRCKVLGEEHLDTLTSLNNLAVTYNELGEYRKALKLEEKAYTLSSKVLGEEHPDTLTSLNNLAVTYNELGEYRKALKLKEKAYTLRCKILGEEHPDTLMSLCNLAVTYGDLGEYRKALELKEKVYTLHCKVLGEEHPYTITALNNIVVAYGKLKEYRKMIELEEKAYTLSSKVLGEEHPDTLTSLNNLAATYGMLGEHRKTLELREKAYTLRCKVLGEEHPDTLMSLGNLAVTYNELGEYRKALKLEERTYTLCRKILGEEHPDTLFSLNNLAVTYGNLWNIRKSLEFIKKAYTLRCKVLGEEHPDTLDSLHYLAMAYQKQGNTKKAAELYNKYIRTISKQSNKTSPK